MPLLNTFYWKHFFCCAFCINSKLEGQFIVCTNKHISSKCYYGKCYMLYVIYPHASDRTTCETLRTEMW